MATTSQEPHGRVVGEAAATGAPTIAPMIGGITEQIRHGVDGLLFRFLDQQDLAKQMARLLEEPDLFGHLVSNLRQPRDTREAMGELEDHLVRLVETSATSPD